MIKNNVKKIKILVYKLRNMLSIVRKHGSVVVALSFKSSDPSSSPALINFFLKNNVLRFSLHLLKRLVQ